MIMSVQYFQPSPDQLSKSYKLLGYKMSSVYLALITLAVKYNSDFLFPLFIWRVFERIDLLSACDLTSLYSLVILSPIHYAHQPLCWQKCMQFMQSGQQLPVFVVKDGISPFTVVNWAEQLSACCWLGLAAITPHYVFLCQSFNVKAPTANGESTVILATTLKGLCLIQNQFIHPEFLQ